MELYSFLYIKFPRRLYAVYGLLNNAGSSRSNPGGLFGANPIGKEVPEVDPNSISKAYRRLVLCREPLGERPIPTEPSGLATDPRSRKREQRGSHCQELVFTSAVRSARSRRSAAGRHSSPTGAASWCIAKHHLQLQGLRRLQANICQRKHRGALRIRAEGLS